MLGSGQVARRGSRRPVAGRRAGRAAPPGRLRGLVNAARVVGALLALASATSIGWLVTSPGFRVDEASVELSGVLYTDPAAVHAAIGLPPGGANVFLLNTAAMHEALAALPPVAAAEVRAELPHRLLVAISERAPILLLAHGGATYLVDGEGVVLERRAANAPALPGLPLVDDRRVSLATPIEVGRAIDATEAAAMLQLGALTPALLGSSAQALVFSVDDNDGFVVSAAPGPWRAVFGHYTATLRPPTEIAQQVQCLRSVLATGEAAIDTIYLAPQDARCGTYLPRPT